MLHSELRLGPDHRSDGEGLAGGMKFDINETNLLTDQFSPALIVCPLCMTDCRDESGPCK